MTSFPRDFVWGAATAAHQVEGNNINSDLWVLEHCKPTLFEEPSLDACDHYHRFRTDFALMRRLGIRHHRLSIAWPRIFPDGRGRANPKGLEFYARLVDEMLKAEITPWVTLYHWDLPQTLEDEGGWRVRATAEAFSSYAQSVVRLLGDRVKNWITLNEIPCFIGLSYGRGIHAPGARESHRVLNQAYHHALLAHGFGAGAVREWGGRGARVGLVHNPDVPIPVTETSRDIAAAEKLFADGNAQILAPIYHGAYPESFWRKLGENRPKIQGGDLELISAPTDFLGLNVYSGSFIRAGRAGRPEVLTLPGNYPRADLTWLNHAPQSMYWALHHAATLYKPASLYVTENGAGYEDEPNAAGEIIDLHRRDYVRNHLIAVHRALQDGLPVRGYFLWSFLDNFEWAEGYIKRFGIIYNDFKTQRRTPKLSAHWYSRVIAENRIL